MLDLLLVKRNAIDQPKIKRDTSRSQHFRVAGVYGAEAESQLVKPLGMGWQPQQAERWEIRKGRS